MEQSIQTTRKEVHSLVGALHTHCQICVQVDRRTSGKSYIRLMSDVHHIWGRSRNPYDIRESILGVLPLCIEHHLGYPPLLSVYEYRRRSRHWDLLLDAWWRVILTYSVNDIGKPLYDIIWGKIMSGRDLTNEALTEIFLSGVEFNE